MRGLLESPCVKVFGAYSMFWMCVYFRRTSHSFTQSSVGVALCLASSLAPPTAVLLQPSESPISQLLKPVCVVSRWRNRSLIPCSSAEVVILCKYFRVQAFKKQHCLPFSFFHIVQIFLHPIIIFSPSYPVLC